MVDNFKNILIEKFSEYESRLNGHRSSRIHQIRRSAIEKFGEIGFPTTKDEEWRFTPAGFVHKHNFRVMLEPVQPSLSSHDIDKFLIKDLKENLLVFINGFYSPELSGIGIKKHSIIVGSFAEALEQDAGAVHKYFSQFASFENDGFTALNTAFAQDGAFVVIPDGAIIEEPIHFLFLNDSREGPVLSQARNLIVAGECSQFKIIESTHTIGDNPAFSNIVSEMVLRFSSNAEYYKLQDDSRESYYVGTTHINQRKASIFHGATISLNGKFIRNNLISTLNDESCEAVLNGLFFMEGNDFIDNHTVIDHAKPNCFSKEIYKGILDNEASAVFSGKIIVRQYAQKTNAYQANRNILLTDNAKINTKPQLEIYADDVKCSHGATSGQLNKDALFYMHARGISPKAAKSLLLNAFAGEIIEKISLSELRDDIKRKIAERLQVDDIYFCGILDKTK